MDTIGEKIKFIRKEKRFTQDSFGQFLGFSKQIISNYENNLSKPNFEFLIQLTHACDVNLNWLIAGIGEPFNTVPEKDTTELDAIIEAHLKKHGLI